MEIWVLLERARFRQWSLRDHQKPRCDDPVARVR